MGDEYVIVGQKDDGESFIGLMNQLLAKMSDFPKNMMEIIHQILEIHNIIYMERFPNSATSGLFGSQTASQFKTDQQFLKS